MSFVQALRQRLIVLLGVVGKSGSGKTKSALLLARGLVGPSGKIFAIDSENRRMSYHADDPAIGGFQVADLQPPYSPEAYLELIREAKKAGADVLVIDSLSHEWNGEGGCLSILEKILDDKAGQDWSKRDKFKMFAWGRVTPKHDALVAELCRFPIPIICCFRAKDKIVMEKADDEAPSGAGPATRQKTVIHTEEDAPIQRKDLVHEMTMIFAMEKRDGEGGYFRIQKRTTEGLFQAVSKQGERMSIQHGAAIAEWCKSPSVSGAAPAQPMQPAATTSRKAPATQAAKTPTAETRKWALSQLLPEIGESLVRTYFEQKAWILPTETFNEWPLDKVPNSRAALMDLSDAIRKFKETGNV